MTGELFRDWLIWYIGPERQVVLYWITLVDISLEMLDQQIFELNIFLQIQHPNYSLVIKGLFVHLDCIEKYPTLESRQYHTKKGDVKVHKFAPYVRKV